ncbi:MAG: hypothetical protein JOZ56_10790 [Actinobacteria bacterium]|nr:hypothetical protein [Actinomycetota bacterium]MBV8563568.1 hypothetical protein [Actinomycetota bacterium]
MKARLLLVLLALAAAAFPAAASASHRAGACTPGMTKVAGTDARTFCGPAKATVTVGGKTLSFSGGACEHTAAYVSVNIGTVVLGQTSAKKPDYFGLNVGAGVGAGNRPAPHDGSYTGAVVAAVKSGKSYLVRGDTAKVTLAGNRSHGTFASTLLFGGGAVSGTFSCG